MLTEVNYRNNIEKYVHNTVTLEECRNERALYEARKK